MTYLPKTRPHLIERAVQALGGGAATATEAGPASSMSAPPPPAAEARATTPVPSAAPARAIPAPPAASPVAAVEVAALRRAGLVVGTAQAARSRLSEEFGVVRQQVLRTLRKAEPVEGHCPRVVLVTSARPGEGKSFTALNLAASIAAGGTQPVLLIDADGKRDSLSELLGLAEAPGIRHLAAAPPGAGRLAAPLRPTAQPGLSVMPYGTAADAAEVPAGPLLAQAILRLAKTLPDHVLILDSPPCLATSDPGSLAGIAGQVLMVVQAERTQRAEVEAALDLVEACPVLQLVLNRTRLTSGEDFGSYGYDAYRGYPSPPTPQTT